MPRAPDNFDVLPRRQGLPQAVRATRQSFGRANVKNEKVIGPRIEAHLLAFRVALDELEQMHRVVAEETDLDLRGESRQAASWLVAGRILGLLEASMSLAEAGFASELVPNLRTAHEATQLLRAFTGHRDPAVLRDWLANHHIKPQRVRQAEDRWQKEIREDMSEAGLDPPGPTKAFFEAHYKGLSEFAHIKRSRIAEIPSVETREMPLGPHPSVTIRAVFVYHLGVQVLEAVPAIGFALASSLGDFPIHRTQRALMELLKLVRDIPIDPATLEGQGENAA